MFKTNEIQAHGGNSVRSMAEAYLKMSVDQITQSFYVDGEAIICDTDGHVISIKAGDLNIKRNTDIFSKKCQLLMLTFPYSFVTIVYFEVRKNKKSMVRTLVAYVNVKKTGSAIVCRSLIPKGPDKQGLVLGKEAKYAGLLLPLFKLIDNKYK